MSLTPYQPAARAVFRAMLSTIFIVAGLQHLLRPETVAARLAEAPFAGLATWIAEPVTLVVLAGIALLAGGVAFLAGFFTQLAALLLLGVLIPITLTVQVGSAEALGPLFKNIGLAGGLVYFITHGADAFSIDSLRRRRGVQAQPINASRASA